MSKPALNRPVWRHSGVHALTLLTLIGGGIMAARVGPSGDAAETAGAQLWSLTPTEGDFVVSNFTFANGETIPKVRLHYRTVGTRRKDANGAVRNAVLLLHGTG